MKVYDAAKHVLQRHRVQETYNGEWDCGGCRWHGYSEDEAQSHLAHEIDQRTWLTAEG